jgi:thiamine pyrophosphate-dependent acetolactate synthase large subunit-like protein
MLAAAKRPTLYVGVGLRCHGLTELVVRLAEHLRFEMKTWCAAAHGRRR